MLVAKHKEKTRILVVDVLNAFLLKAAVLLLLGVDVNRVQIAYVLVSHDVLFYGLILALRFLGNFVGLAALVATRLGVRRVVLVHASGQEANDSLVSTKVSLEGKDH